MTSRTRIMTKNNIFRIKYYPTVIYGAIPLLLRRRNFINTFQRRFDSTLKTRKTVFVFISNRTAFVLTE